MNHGSVGPVAAAAPTAAPGAWGTPPESVGHGTHARRPVAAPPPPSAPPAPMAAPSTDETMMLALPLAQRPAADPPAEPGAGANPGPGVPASGPGGRPGRAGRRAAHAGQPGGGHTAGGVAGGATGGAAGSDGAPSGAHPWPAAGDAAAPSPAGATRTGSPIVPPGTRPALLTAAFAVLLLLAALLGMWTLVPVVMLLQVLTAAGWFRLNGMWPARQGIALAALSALVADVALLVVGPDGSGMGRAGALAGVLGAVWLLPLAQQMARRGGREELIPAVTVTASATVVSVMAGTFLPALRAAQDAAEGAVGWPASAPIVLGVSAVAVAVLAAAAPAARLPGPLRNPGLRAGAGLALAAGVGAVLGGALGVGALAGLVLAAVAGVLGLAGRRVASYDFPSAFVHHTAGVALPLALAAPGVWLAAVILA
ncbi:hypothetical protein [Allostreptomyces psammosilenae]|uniref:Uncharacterized protein n=1 Tax=Allostreptomyces psammosilenae TaxID=1892865 RepID=A0A852ZYU5_9ACTN|nr:hypothetical protein [Allostreptomyces psammosilenae]NYI07516.1 hypothetical protein [Allostreptomyces psammosilenae]